MNKDQVRGRVEQAKGALKEVAGKIAHNARLEAEGRVAKETGKARANYGDLKEGVRDAAKDEAKSAERTAAERSAEQASLDRAADEERPHDPREGL